MGRKGYFFDSSAFFLIHPKYDLVHRTPTNYICHKIWPILVFEDYKVINSDLHFKYIPLQRALHQLLTFFYYGHHT